jgi:hypothetical protein
MKPEVLDQNGAGKVNYAVRKEVQRNSKMKVLCTVKSENISKE